jgi:hypothetical protein
MQVIVTKAGRVTLWRALASAHQPRAVARKFHRTIRQRFSSRPWPPLSAAPAAMRFALRLLVLITAVLGLGVAFAWAWDKSDAQARAAQEAPQR